MFDNFFYKIGLKYTKFKFRKSIDEPKRFTNFLEECGNVLIILPNDPKQFDEAKDTILELKKDWPQRQISVIVRSQFASIHEFKEYFHTIGITKDDINRFYLPKKKFIAEIKNISYDLIIDLNLDLFLPSSFLTKVINSKYRIGIKKDLVDLFYNFQFDPINYSNFKNIYVKLFNNLNMFGQSGE
jgi:ADP-heptose:LPS heptosyltransferase